MKYYEGASVVFCKPHYLKKNVLSPKHIVYSQFVFINVRIN